MSKSILIDIVAIKARLYGWSSGDAWHIAYALADIRALVAEVERLQSYASDCEQHATFATSKSTALERAAVVAWLRLQAYLTLYEAKPDDLADAIERGDHRAEVTE